MSSMEKGWYIVTTPGSRKAPARILRRDWKKEWSDPRGVPVRIAQEATVVPLGEAVALASDELRVGDHLSIVINLENDAMKRNPKRELESMFQDVITKLVDGDLGDYFETCALKDDNGNTAGRATLCVDDEEEGGAE